MLFLTRPWAALFAALLAWSGVASGQVEPAGEAAPAGTAAGSGEASESSEAGEKKKPGSSGSGSKPGGATTGSGTTKPAGPGSAFSTGSGTNEASKPAETGPAFGTGSNSAFRSGSGSSSTFNVFSSEPPVVPVEPLPPAATDATEPESDSSFNVTSSGASGGGAPSAAAPSFTVPGFYGQGSTTFFGGAGRLARPRFRTGVTFGFGYDDNIFSAPRSTPRILPGGSSLVDEVEPQQVLVEPSQPIMGVVGFRFNPPFDELVPVMGVVGFTDPVFEEVVPFEQEVRGSFFTRLGLNVEMQRYSARSLFTLNASGAHSYYLDREEEPTDYSGNFAASYVHRFTPRLQATVQASAAYISQPDLSRPNTPQRQTQGDLVQAQLRGDLRYRITPRISLSATGNFSSYHYTEQIEQSGNFDEYTFGLEASYLWKPRWTLMAEYRHAWTAYENRTDIDSTTDYLLLGTQFILSPRLSGSLRAGAAHKQFELSSDAQTAPYVESTVSYRSTARSQISWTNRFGFEETQDVNSERLVYRAGINYSYMFSPRVQGIAGINLVHELVTNKLSDDKFATDTFEATLGFEYNLSRNFLINGSYSLTLLNSNFKASDYYRNRLFLGGQYSF